MGRFVLVSKVILSIYNSIMVLRYAFFIWPNIYYIYIQIRYIGFRPPVVLMRLYQFTQRCVAQQPTAPEFSIAFRGISIFYGNLCVLVMSGLEETCCQKSRSFLTEPIQLRLILVFCLFLLVKTWLIIIEPFIAPPDVPAMISKIFLLFSWLPCVLLIQK